MTRLTHSKSKIAAIFFATILIHLCSAEMFHTQRDPSIGNIRLNQQNRNMIQTDGQCKLYLCKYGYLNCNCDGQARTKRQTLPNGMFPRELGVNSGSPATTAVPIDLVPPRSDVECTSSQIRDALRQFQKNYRLAVTGTCTAATKNSMSKRRCGQPDTDVKYEPKKQPSRRRSKKSLSDMLIESTQLDASVARRKRMLEDYKKAIEIEVIDPNRQPTRVKRSVEPNQDYNGIWNKRVITWRLMSQHYSPLISPANQRAILRLAFRHWSEVSPICFKEANDSDYVDIEIGFLEGIHLSCVRKFDGFGGEIAHKYYRDVHFDKSEHYTTTTSVTSDAAISLLLVAVHELGHVVGLNHTVDDESPRSVMNAIYHRTGSFELSQSDREAVKRAYGPCKGSFDTAFDYVRWRVNTDGVQERVFNTYFFRGDHYWMYENSLERTRTGDPLEITPEWAGLPENINAYFHYQAMTVVPDSTGASKMELIDEYYFFKGDRYYKYSSGTESVLHSGRIDSKFKRGRNGSIPNNLDTVFFDVRDGLTYFFKDDYVYTYDYRPNDDHSCCVTGRQRITDMYPPATSADLTAPSGRSYARNIDSIYFSYFSMKFYIIKGDDVWVNEGYDISRANIRHSIKYVGKWHDLWNYICDGECS